jgi:hypothetical protein
VSSITIVSDVPSCGITYSRHSDNSRSVIYDRILFVIQATDRIRKCYTMLKRLGSEKNSVPELQKKFYNVDTSNVIFISRKPYCCFAIALNFKLAHFAYKQYGVEH